MDEIWLDVLGLFAVIVLVLLNGFFVAAEFALVSVRPTRIAELEARGDARARWVQKAISDPDRFIAATQLGITLASLGLGWIGEPALSGLLEPILSLFPVEVEDELSHTISAAISFSIITFLHVVIGELAPKSIALQSPDQTSLAVARPTVWAEWIFKPAIWVLNGAGNALLKWAGVEPASGHDLMHSVDELKMLVTASAEGGIVEDQAEEMLHAVFDFGELIIRHVMIPRTEMIAIPADTILDDILELAVDQPYTKFPVFADSLDQIIGVVHMKDLIPALSRDDSTASSARDLMREAIFIPETARVSTLLPIFRARRQHIAIVLDEYGGTAGIVTLTDLLEEIVGEVSDIFEAEQDIEPQPDGSTIVDGLTLIEDVNDLFGLELEDPNYDTIAGYMLGRLQRLARVGDVVVVDGYTIRVEAMDGYRIARVSIDPLPGSSTQQTDDGVDA